MTNKSGFPLCLHINTGIEKLHSRVFSGILGHHAPMLRACRLAIHALSVVTSEVLKPVDMASDTSLIIAPSSGEVDFVGQDDLKWPCAQLKPPAQSRIAILLRPDIAAANAAGALA